MDFMRYLKKSFKGICVGFIVSVLTFQFAFGAQWEPSDCEKVWLSSSENESKMDRVQRIENLRLHYNELLEQTVTRAEAESKIQDLIASYGEANPAFPSDLFLKWLKTGNWLDREFAHQDQRKLGDVAQALYHEYFPFLKKEQQTLAERAQKFSSSVAQNFDDLWNKTQSTGKLPAQDMESFSAKALRSFLQFTQGTCLQRSDAFFKSMLSNVVVTVLMFGLHAAREKPEKPEDFPWEFFFNDMFWSVAFDRVACAKMISIEHQLGAHLAAPGKLGYLNKAKENLKKTVLPFIPYYALGAVTGSAGNWYMDRFQRGITEEEKPNDVYFYNFGFFNLFNAAWTIPKRVFLLDPVYAKAFPKLEAAIEGLTQSGLAAKVVRYGTEYPAKIALSEYAQFSVFLDAKSYWENETLPSLKKQGASFASSVKKEMIPATILIPKKFLDSGTMFESNLFD